MTAYSDCLNAAFLCVREFHTTFDHAAPLTPTMQPLDEADARAGFIESECEELRDARTLEDQADAYLDILYFAIGGFVALGVEPSRLFQIVQGANMAKVWPDGTVRHREGDRKVLKPPGWAAPEPAIRAEVARQEAIGTVLLAA